MTRPVPVAAPATYVNTNLHRAKVRKSEISFPKMIDNSLSFSPSKCSPSSSTYPRLPALLELNSATVTPRYIFLIVDYIV